VRFETPPGDILLLAGYSADVDIILARHDNVLRLPAEALVEGKSVLVWNPATKKLAKRDVKTGVSNWTWVEVLDGVKEGDRVATSLDRDGVVDGGVVEPEAAASTK
jgi:HlyD family secretion protein